MRILMIGKPASGKGTITQRIINEDFVQLSTGDLLREEQAKNTPLGREIKELLKLGKFATDETIFALVDKFLIENKGKSIVFDGFPRNVAQAKRCLEMGIEFDHIFSIEVPDEIVTERIVNRRVHPASGRVYNIKTLPPKKSGLDDLTGEPLVQRNDDRAEVVGQRLENFNNFTLPIINFLEQKGYHITKIDGLAPISTQVAIVKEELEQKQNKKPKM